ncbi:hypothetical protein GALL_423270 [mine drainage metagenome]|uniref:Uncharacterized protein n=1 Tax=mine drainage metagenome TaxID=410659 RepID=A0A1J5QER2_9ZZZZ
MPERGARLPSASPTRSPARASSTATASPSTRARSIFSTRPFTPENAMDCAMSIHSETDCAACHSFSRTKCASDRAERRQSMPRASSPAWAGRYCQNSSPMPARLRPCSPSITGAARCSASASKGGKLPPSPSARARNATGDAMSVTPPPRSASLAPPPSQSPPSGFHPAPAPRN